MTEVNPFERHPMRRFSYAWQALRGRSGRQLDIGCNTGEFLDSLERTTPLECHGIDAHAGYLELARKNFPQLKLRQAAPGVFRLPYDDGMFDSVTLLDTLEHVRDEAECLDEVRRVLAPGGIVVITVPRRHLFSLLDPDNAKYRVPRLHRWIYSRRFGTNVYHQRFVDISDGLRGDIAAEKTEHTNYRTDQLLELLRCRGFVPIDVSGANLFWRFFHVPALLVRSARLREAFERMIYWDGRLFRAANLFVTAQKPETDAAARRSGSEPRAVTS
jgi:ubiquinone/menaquinone biosynthesis C-methylase UbiE